MPKDHEHSYTFLWHFFLSQIWDCHGGGCEQYCFPGSDATRLHSITTHKTVIFTHFFAENYLRETANRRKTNVSAVFFSGKWNSEDRFLSLGISFTFSSCKNKWSRDIRLRFGITWDDNTPVQFWSCWTAKVSSPSMLNRTGQCRGNIRCNLEQVLIRLLLCP